MEGEERRKAAKTVTSRPWGLPFLGREVYKERTFSDTLWPKLVPSEDENEDAIDMAEIETEQQQWVCTVKKSDWWEWERWEMTILWTGLALESWLHFGLLEPGLCVFFNYQIWNNKRLVWPNKKQRTQTSEFYFFLIQEGTD